MIELRDLALGYQNRSVIQGVNLMVAAGDFIVIGGPNGGGKSTLLRGIAGLLDPMAGSIHRGSTGFGYVPQHAGIDHALPLTAMEMVELGASSRQPWWKTIITPRSSFHREALGKCRAADLSGKPFHSLSGGQRQRVLLARALASAPDCLLLDEPTAGVDRQTQHSLAAMLDELHRSSHLGVILVTHEFAPFRGIANRFFWVQDGTLAELSAADFSGRQHESLTSL